MMRDGENQYTGPFREDPMHRVNIAAVTGLLTLSGCSLPKQPASARCGAKMSPALADPLETEATPTMRVSTSAG